MISIKEVLEEVVVVEEVVSSGYVNGGRGNGIG